MSPKSNVVTLFQDCTLTDVREQGIRSLKALFGVGQGQGERARTVRLFLLGLHDPKAWPFNLTLLRTLNEHLVNQCLEVIELDVRSAAELHTYHPRGEDLLQQFHALETHLQKVDKL